MSLAELIKKQWPSANENQIESVVWLTPYPIGTKESVEASLRKMHAKWGSNINDVIKGEMDAFDAEFKRYNEEQKLNKSST